MLSFTLVNNSDNNLYVLKWLTPLEGIADEIFRVELDGEAVAYRGILASRTDPTPESYVLLEPGEMVSAEVDLAKSYDFTEKGSYSIEFISPRSSYIAQIGGRNGQKY